MKKFNEVITIEVSVDSIAQQLLNTISPEFKHREILAEAIIGRMKKDNSLSYLYNSLNGCPCEIDFKIGEEVCTDKPLKVYGYWTPESIATNNTVNGDVSSAKIIEIDEYDNDKLLIEFEVPTIKAGVTKKIIYRVSHLNWNLVRY